MSAFLESLISAGGVWGFFLAILLEEIIVPLPSSLIMTAGGFFLIQADNFSAAIAQVFLKLVIPGAVGVTLGSLFFYFLSFYGGAPALERIGPKFGFAKREIEKIQNFFQKNYSDEMILFFLRALPIFPGAAVSVMAGFLKMPVWNFLILNLAGSAIRVLIMGVLGWQARSAYSLLAVRFENLSNLFFVFSLFAIVAVYLVLKKKLAE